LPSEQRLAFTQGSASRASSLFQLASLAKYVVVLIGVVMIVQSLTKMFFTYTWSKCVWDSKAKNRIVWTVAIYCGGYLVAALYCKKYYGKWRLSPEDLIANK
jgi:hypothetical protein